MTIVRSIKYNSSHKLISKILVDGGINLIIPYEDEIFEYKKTDGAKHKVIVVEFNYKQKIVKQAFYQCTNKYEGTWLPFDGVKADVDGDNEFYTFLDTDSIGDLPFGKEELKCVSYVLGGGMWKDPESDFSKSLGVEPRISYFDCLNTKVIEPYDSIYLNHYINYAITDNYGTTQQVKWIEGEHLKSAFSFSNKMDNSYQIEYTPRRIKGAKTRVDYAMLYAKINKSKIKIPRSSSSGCTIL
jgi:hypothetical protein